VKSVARSLTAAVTTLTLVGVAAWGCASQGNAPAPEHDWRHYEPDGGWQTFEPRQYDVDPLKSALGPTVPFMPTTAPVNAAAPTIH
jgi:hypothetical protein